MNWRSSARERRNDQGAIDDNQSSLGDRSDNRGGARFSGTRGPTSAAPAAAKAKVAAVSATTARATLDKYCVGCHNDKLKVSNFSIEKADLSKAGEDPETWERVIRKMRAGMMPPPGMPRPPLAEYEGTRDRLETQMDRAAAAHPNPGSVILHRLNRTEYANAIRDLLDLQIDPATLLPGDGSARGFDNVAGSLTISPTLLEAYTRRRRASHAWPSDSGNRPPKLPTFLRATLRKRNGSKVFRSVRAAVWRSGMSFRPTVSIVSWSPTSDSENSFLAKRWRSLSTTN